MPQIFKIIFLFYLYGLKFLGPGCHSKIFQRKMCSPWSENFLRNCEKVSNVTLVCKDGKLTSHKIVLARISDYIRDLMLLIPNEEDIIIMLPDFPIKVVRDFVSKHIFKGRPNTYRVIIKEGQKVNAYYTAKICLFGAPIRFILTTTCNHLIIYL